MGDVHALMGEGESNGMGIEAGSNITLCVRKEEKPLTNYPYLLLNGKLIVIASAENLDKASWLAVEAMQHIVIYQGGDKTQRDDDMTIVVAKVL